MRERRTLVLVDGSSLAFRSFYALFKSGMRTADNVPTWAVYGFFRALFDLLRQRLPDMVAVCFDTAAATFRHEEFKEYKAHRLEMPDDLALQWPLIKEGVRLTGIPVYELDGFEADDLIGTLAFAGEESGMDVLILTGDQDAFQLLDGRIQVLMPGPQGLVVYGRQEVKEKLGVWPEQVTDYKALCGDSSDNIPGVRGVGPKTAVPLLERFGTVEKVLDNIDSIDQKGLRQKLIEGRQKALISKGLATIRLDAPISFDFNDCLLTMPSLESLTGFLRKLQFNSILRELPAVLAPFNGGVPPDIDESILSPVAAGAGKTGGPATPLASLPELNVNVVRCEEELDDLLSKLAGQEIISVDLETDGLRSLECQIVGWALAWSADFKVDSSGRPSPSPAGSLLETAYIPVRHQGADQLGAQRVASRLKVLLEDAKIGKLAQNAKFEMNVLSACGIKLSPVVFDPMLASYVVDPDEKHGLKSQSERILGHEMVKITDLIGSGRKQITMDLVPVEKAAPYAADDARIALELARYWCEQLSQEQRFLLYDMELPLQAVLARMEQAGVALDAGYLESFSKELGRDLDILEREIHSLAGHQFNIGSTKQLQAVLFEELGLGVPDKRRAKTKTGYSTDAGVLEAMAGKHPITGKILEYRQLSKLKSTYVDALPRQISMRDGRLHGEFNQTVTSTGRLSSSNPNLQNIPIKTDLGRRIRRAFVPGESNCLILSADYSQIELRLLAHMSGDEALVAAYKSNMDIHALTASHIFSVPIEKVDAAMRRVGKTINFSLIYQQGAYSTAQDLGIPVSEARQFIDKYFETYPKVRSFMEKTIAGARRDGFVSTLWGRRRYFQHLNDRNEVVRRGQERAAGNAPLQGSAADLMKLAMVRLEKQLVERGLAARLILQVHDELVLELPESEADETERVVREAMLFDQPLSVPLVVDTAAGSSWFEAK